MERGGIVTLKISIEIMITENMDVLNGMCDGTTGYIAEIKSDNKKYITSVLAKDNKYFDISPQIYDVTIDKQTHSITNEFMPIKQYNAIPIHKAQGTTIYEKVILGCNKMFENSMFYTAISRMSDRKNRKIINFKEYCIKCDMTAFYYESKGEYVFKEC